jgi:predicted transcriptional regulator YheO
MVPDLARALGPDHEVVLHDLRLTPNSIVAIGGNLTGRSVGGPTTNLLLQLVHQGRTDNVLRYQTRSANGRILRSSTLFIRDPDGRPVGCLCINTDITEWLGAQALVHGVTKVAPLESVDSRAAGTENGVIGDGAGVQRSEDRSPSKRDAQQDGGLEEAESFAPTVDELAVSLVRKAIENVGVPVELMQKPHKLQVVRELEARGLFLLRDAVDLTANLLSISRYSVYNYLKELKAAASREDGSSPRQGRAKRRRLPLSQEGGIREGGEAS